jgi:hypothetical protein
MRGAVRQVTMDSQQLIEHAKRLAEMNQRVSQNDSIGPYSQACEFLRTNAGEKSAFYESARKISDYSYDYRAQYIASTLLSFAQYIESGLKEEITPERRAQLDIVSDLLDQANSLLQDKTVHGAAPAVLIGSTLEEFLRTWVEKEGLSLGNRKPSLDTYSKLLREADLIDKQDMKDITAWAGIRNDSAHGHWDKVESKEKISLMLQGVNLFMRKYEAGKSA